MGTEAEGDWGSGRRKVRVVAEPFVVGVVVFSKQGLLGQLEAGASQAVTGSIQEAQTFHPVG